MFFLLSSCRLKSGRDIKVPVGVVEASDIETAIKDIGLKKVTSYKDEYKEGDCQTVVVLKNKKGRRHFLEAIEEISGLYE